MASVLSACPPTSRPRAVATRAASHAIEYRLTTMLSYRDFMQHGVHGHQFMGPKGERCAHGALQLSSRNIFRTSPNKASPVTSTFQGSFSRCQKIRPKVHNRDIITRRPDRSVIVTVRPILSGCRGSPEVIFEALRAGYPMTPTPSP